MEPAVLDRLAKAKLALMEPPFDRPLSEVAAIEDPRLLEKPDISHVSYRDARRASRKESHSIHGS